MAYSIIIYNKNILFITSNIVILAISACNMTSRKLSASEVLALLHQNEDNFDDVHEPLQEGSDEDFDDSSDSCPEASDDSGDEDVIEDSDEVAIPDSDNYLPEFDTSTT